jgi:pyruvate/2-oxoglutarate dehydrogenase complex dihydrolipoamide acyltransferase (E2) component
MAEHPHRRAIAAGAAALLIGFVIALIVAGGDDDRSPGPETAERTATTEPGTETEATGETETAPQAVEPAEPTVPQRDLAAIQATVVLLVESAEVRDGEGVCRALGQSPNATSRDAAQDCADRAGIDLAALPGSDELSFDHVDASGSRGRAELANGDVITLRRRGGRWVVTGIES